MYISSISPGSAASAVWGAASRTLTSITGSPGPVTPLSQTQINIAAATTLTLQPTGQECWMLQINVLAGAAGTLTQNITDGINTQPQNVIAAGNASTFSTVQSTIVVYHTYVNADAVNPAKIMYTGFKFT